MPGVDFTTVQSLVPMAKVLELIGFTACRGSGDQIHLWAKLNDKTVHEAAVDLCGRAGVPVPWIKRW